MATTLDKRVLSVVVWPLWISDQHQTSPFLRSWQEHFSQGV